MSELSPAKMAKKLRDMTGAGILDCTKALKESDGSFDAAVEFLQKKSIVTAEKRAVRIAAEGVVGSYIHMGGKIGVLTEVNCETDFVAKTDQFQQFVRDVSMHIAAMSPIYLDQSEIPATEVAKQRAIYAAQMKESGKPDNIIGKIVDGKIKKWHTDICLLDQGFVKDSDKSVRQLVTDMVSATGENVKIRRFVRFGLGDGLEKKTEDFAAEVAEAMQ
jgi:elongation factor Ts